MSKKKHVSEDELAVFYKAIEGIEPLPQNKVRLASSTQPIRKVKREIDIERLNLSNNDHLPPLSAEAFVAYKHDAISNKNLRKLRKGQYNVEATLDLHGMKAEEAMVAVERFLQQCVSQNMRVVLIIHGKGYHSNQSPILKNKLNHWLREISFVLAFSSAAPKHGSRGAMYVLLKKDKSEENFD